MEIGTENIKAQDQLTELPYDILKIIASKIKDPNTIFKFSLVSNALYQILRSKLDEVKMARLSPLIGKDLANICLADESISLLVLNTPKLREKLGGYNIVKILSIEDRFRASLKDHAFAQALTLLNYYQGKYLFQVACMSSKTIKLSLKENEIINQLSQEQIDELNQLNNKKDIKFNI